MCQVPSQAFGTHLENKMTKNSEPASPWDSTAVCPLSSMTISISWNCQCPLLLTWGKLPYLLSFKIIGSHEI